MGYKYHVAISFANEDRNAALALALALELNGIKEIYYYPDKQPADAGKKLEHELKAIYSLEARYIVILLSKKYFKKPTAMVELEAIQQRMSREPNVVSVIPVKLHKGVSLKDHEGLKELQWLDWEFQPKRIVEGLLEIFKTNNIPINKETKQNIDRRDVFFKQVNRSKKSRDQSNNATLNL